MNRSYKVVFNRARGLLMAANEMTRSVTRSATAKTVTATLALSVGSALASTPVTVSWTGAAAPELPVGTQEVTGAELAGLTGNTFTVLKASGEASGVLNDASVVLRAMEPYSTTGAQDRQLMGLLFSGTSAQGVELGGETLTVDITTDLVGGGNNQAAGVLLQKAAGATDKVTVSAKTTTVSVTSTNTNGKSVYGFATNADLTLTGQTVNVNLESATERTQDSQYSEAIGFDVFGGQLNVSADTTINMTGKTTSTLATRLGTGATPITGIKLEGGGIVADGRVNLDVSAVGGDASGVVVTNYYATSDWGKYYFGSVTGSFADLAVQASSVTGNAYGLTTTVTPVPGASSNVVLVSSGQVDVNATTTSGTAYGIALLGNSTIRLSGNTRVTATALSDAGQAYAVYAQQGI